MLRITVHDNPGALTFQLEGRLAGLWVGDVEARRQRALAGRRGLAVRFELTGATCIDAVGKAYLADMHRLGGEFIATDCLTKTSVAELAKGSRSECERPKREGENQSQLNCGAT